MSATLDSNPSATLRKRCREEETNIPLELKRSRIYIRLESESSKASEEDSESVYSIQDRETDVVRDTSDTDSRTESDQDEYEVEIEYEVASLSGDETASCVSSSGSDQDMMLAAAAAAICDSSFEAWVTDCEDSDNSTSLDETSFGRTDFMTCVQCKGTNDNPLYRYCEKCFQSCRQCKMRKTYKCFPLCNSCYKDRKKFFPPRPRRHKKSKRNQTKTEPPVKLDTLRNCLSGLSQDSGIGSSQECPPLDLDQIVVPKHLTPGTSSISSYGEENLQGSKESTIEQGSKLDTNSVSNFSSGNNLSDTISVSDKQHSSFSSVTSVFNNESVKKKSKSRKRQSSESSLSEFEVKRTRRDEKSLMPVQNALHETSDLGSEGNINSFSSTSTDKSDISETSELCIFCNSAPKDSIFLHTNIAHRCCCYRCAKKTLNTIKRCPICNRAVNKVVKIFTS